MQTLQSDRSTADREAWDWARTEICRLVEWKWCVREPMMEGMWFSVGQSLEFLGRCLHSFGIVLFIVGLCRLMALNDYSYYFWVN